MGEIINTLIAGDLTIVTIIIWSFVALICGAVGGAVGGMIVGGKHLGNELAAMMGFFYGPLAALPGAVLGLVILCLL